MPAPAVEPVENWRMPFGGHFKQRSLRGPREIRARLKLDGFPDQGEARYRTRWNRRQAVISPNRRADLPIRGFQVQLSHGHGPALAEVLVPDGDQAHAVAQEFVADGRIPEGSRPEEKRINTLRRGGLYTRTKYNRARQWRTYIAEAMRAQYGARLRGAAIDEDGNRVWNEERQATVHFRERAPQSEPRDHHGTTWYVTTEGEASPAAAVASYDEAEDLARHYVANGRRPGDRTGRDLLPEGVEVTAQPHRLALHLPDGRAAVLNHVRKGDEYATEVHLSRWEEGEPVIWSGARREFEEALDVATDYLDTGRTPTEPSRRPAAFPERHDLPELPRGLEMHRVGHTSAHYVAAAGPRQRDADRRSATVEKLPTFAAAFPASKAGHEYRVTNYEDGEDPEEHYTPTYRDAHLKAREFVRTGSRPRPVDHPERLPIPEPAGFRAERSGPAKGADHAGPSR